MKKDISREEIEAWHVREGTRLRDRTYTPLPGTWTASSWFYGASSTDFHFAHVSVSDDAYIAYTENDQKGVADIQTKVKPGRYLKRYYGHILSDDQIKALATSLSANYKPVELLITQDADEIEKVYRTGPRSCMSGHPSEYEAGIHPARVYAGPDLAVAYIKRDKNITARCVIWPEKKIYSIVYGDYTRMDQPLKAAGYKAGSLHGARIQLIKYGDDYVVPYVDGLDCGSIKKGFIVLDDDGDISLSNTNGVAFNCTVDCCNCNNSIDRNDARSIYNYDGWWCRNCYEENVELCAYYGDYYHIDDMVEMADGAMWYIHAFEKYGFTCPILDTRHPRREGITMHGGALWSEEAFKDFGETNELGQRVPKQENAA